MYIGVKSWLGRCPLSQELNSIQQKSNFLIQRSENTLNTLRKSLAISTTHGPPPYIYMYIYIYIYIYIYTTLSEGLEYAIFPAEGWAPPKGDILGMPLYYLWWWGSNPRYPFIVVIEVFTYLTWDADDIKYISKHFYWLTWS